MGAKKSANTAFARKMARGAVTSGTGSTQRRASAMFVDAEPLPQPQTVASAAAAAPWAPMSTVHGGEGEELEESDRAAQLAALPTLESLSTLEPVVEEANVWLTPLRGGAAAAAVIEESTQGAAATKAENAMWQYIVDKIEADGTGLVVSDVVPGGRASLSFVRSNTLRHRRNGVLMLRIAEFYVTHTVQAFKADVIVASTPKQVTHEVSIPKALFPARVLEQINTQLGAAATVKKAWDDDDEMVYCIVSTSEAMTSRIEKNGLEIGRAHV